MKQVAGPAQGRPRAVPRARRLRAVRLRARCRRRRRKIDRGKRIVELFKQPQYNPVAVEIQVAVIWAVQNGYVDDVPVERIKEFQAEWTDFLTTRKAGSARQKIVDAEGARATRADRGAEGRGRSVQADAGRK